MGFNPDVAAPNVHRVQLGRRIMKNSLANYVATIFNTLSSLAALGMLTRYLTLEDFGKYSFVVAIAAVFKVVAGMGVPSIVARDIARSKENAGEIYASAFLLHIFFSVITVIIMTVSINLTSSQAIVRIVAPLCAAAVVLELFSKLFSAIFQAYEKMVYDVYQTVVAQSVYVVLTVCVVIFDYGLIGIFTALLLGFVAECLIGIYIVNKKFVKLRFKGNMGQWKYLLKEAYPIGLKAILRKLGYRIDTLVLAAMKSSVEVGLFHGVYKMVQSLTFLAEGATRAIFPVFSRYSVTSKESLQQGYEKSFKFLVLIGLPFGIFFSFFSKPVITLILGKAFVDATPVLQIFGWVLALMFLSNLTQKMLVVGNKQSHILLATGVGLVINLVLDIILIYKMSYIGAGIATLVAEMVILGITFYAVNTHVSRIKISRVVLKPIFASIATCIFLFYTYKINIYLAISSAILFYAVVLFLMKTFTRKEIAVLKQVLGKRKPIPD